MSPRRTLLARLLLGLVVLHASGLAAALWLGAHRITPVRVAASPLRLLVTADGAATDRGTLRTAVAEAGMGGGGATQRRHDFWPVPAPFADGRLAVVVEASDAGSRAALPLGLALARGGGEPVLTVSVIDRGVLTERVLWPLLEARLEAARVALDVAGIGLEIVRDGTTLTARLVLARSPRGAAAPSIPRPRLEAPRGPRSSEDGPTATGRAR